MEKNEVQSFTEKPEFGGDWINGGFMVVEPNFDSIKDDSTILEREPFVSAAESKMFTYRHNGFWQCMDTLRDRNELEQLWQSGKAPWKIW